MALCYSFSQPYAKFIILPLIILGKVVTGSKCARKTRTIFCGIHLKVHNFKTMVTLH